MGVLIYSSSHMYIYIYIYSIVLKAKEIRPCNLLVEVDSQKRADLIVQYFYDKHENIRLDEGGMWGPRHLILVLMWLEGTSVRRFHSYSIQQIFPCQMI